MPVSIRFLLLLISVPLLLGGCATRAATGRPPAWIDGEDPRYNRMGYLVGVGGHATRSGAEDEARGAIARIFSAQVESTTASWEKYSGISTGTGGSESFQSAAEVETVTRSFTRELLEGSEIVEGWTGPDGQRYALAVLERAAARARLLQQIDPIDRELEERFALAGQQSSRLARLRHLLKAADLFRRREVVNAELMVVNVNGAGLEPPVDVGTLAGQLARALSEVGVAVEVRGDDAPEVGRAVVESVTRGGLSVVPAGQAADIVVRGTVTGLPVHRASGSGFVFARYEAAFDLADGGAGTTFGGLRLTHKEGALDLADARVKCLDRLARKVVAGLNAELYRFLTD